MREGGPRAPAQDKPPLEQRMGQPVIPEVHNEKKKACYESLMTDRGGVGGFCVNPNPRTPHTQTQVAGLPAAAIEALRTDELRLSKADILAEETDAAKNDLESYIYKARLEQTSRPALCGVHS